MTEHSTPHNNPIAADDFQAPGKQLETRRFKFTKTHALIAAFGVAAILFIAFITIARSVEVKAVAKQLAQAGKYRTIVADVKLDATVKLPLGNRVLVLPGDYSVTMNADGFTPVTQTLSVGEERHQQFEVVMTRLPGSLNVQLSPEVTANAYIDGDLVGELPGTISNIAAGKRELTIDAPLYRSATQSVLIRGKGETQTIEMALDPAWAEYTFSSSPAGATVRVDGEQLGKTPLVARIEEGSHELVVDAPLFKPFKRTISVTAKQNLVIPEIELVPADAMVEVSSQPAGAAVIVNRRFRGTTPMTLTLTPNEEQQLQVYKAGYRLTEDAFSLAPEQTEQKAIELVQDLVPVTISVSPADAKVSVDGRVIGSGSQSLSLNTLPHTISARKAGYVTQTTELIPTRGNKQVVSFKLLTKEQDYWSKLPDTYTTKAGHSMKLFKQLGTVKLGSSRREDGRRSNEAVYTAELTKPFYVSLHETTNKQFRAFKKSHNSGNYKGKSLDAGKAPVVNISWQEAAQYCNWLSEIEGLDPFYQTKAGFVSGNNEEANGYRLLTEVEWAWLARNKNGNVLTYPWGSAKSPPSKLGNYGDESAAELLAFVLSDYDDGFRGPSPIGRFPANHRGLFDLDGNVSEWVNDWYSASGNANLSGDELKDPMGPNIGEFHTIRGGSWAKGYLPQLRLAYREYGAKGKHDVGFRIARYAGLNQKR